MTKPSPLNAIILLIAAPFVYGQETRIDTGSTYEFSGSLDGWFSVYDSSTGDQTHLRISNPGHITGEGDDGVVLYGSSLLSFSGDFIGQDIWARENSQVYMTGGTVGDDIYAESNSQIYLSGGTIVDDLELHDSSTLSFTGGNIGEDLEVGDSAFAIMTGGTVARDTAVFYEGSLFISGGNFLGNDDGGIYSVWGGTLGISGSDFYLNGNPLSYGTITNTEGLLTGTLLDGASLSIYLTVDADSTATFSATAIPEPSTYALLLGITALGLLGYRRYKFTFKTKS